MTTILNGKELKHYDAFLVWIASVEDYFINVKDYKGYPMLPNNWLEGMEIYDKADETEKRMIMGCISTKAIEYLRHWKPDRDELFGPDGWKQFMLCR